MDELKTQPRFESVIASVFKAQSKNLVTLEAAALAFNYSTTECLLSFGRLSLHSHETYWVRLGPKRCVKMHFSMTQVLHTLWPKASQLHALTTS